LEWKHPCSQELDTRAAIHGALEGFEPIDLAFRLTATPRLRDGVLHGLNVTRQRSCELLHWGEARSSGVMKETVELACVGPLEKAAEPHRQPPHHDEARRSFLQSAHLRAPDGVSVGVGLMQSEAATMGKIRQLVVGSMAGASPSGSTFAGGDGNGVWPGGPLRQVDSNRSMWEKLPIYPRFRTSW
jgi:hypothetical protein